MLQLIYAGTIFVTVTAVAMIVLLPFAPNRAKQRLDSISGNTGYEDAAAKTDWTETIVRFAGPFAKLSLPTEGWEKSPLRLRFMHAGYRGGAPVAVFFGAKTILALLFPAIAYLYITIGGMRLSTQGMLLALFAP